METILTLIYAAIVFAVFRVFKVPVNKWTIVTSVLGGVFLLAVLFIGMAYFQPYSKYARFYFWTTPIVPDVRGRVIEVNVQPNQPLKAGDRLFQIDPIPFQARVDSLKAKLALARKRLEESRQLADASAGSQYDVEAYAADVESLKADLEEATFNLDHTQVRAPTAGFVSQLRLRPGMMAVPIPIKPLMTFVHTDAPAFIAGFTQNALQNIKVGCEAEIILQGVPGRVFKARVSKILLAMAEGQLQPAGDMMTFDTHIPEGRVPIFFEFEDDFSGYTLPMGSAGMVAVYSGRWEPVVLIRKVLLRIESWKNFVNFGG